MNCTDELESKSVKPSFEDISVIPSTCNPGDSVTVIVKYAKEGKYFYFYDQKVSLSDTISIFTCNEHTTNLPNVRFKAPAKPGKYTVKFSSKISYTSGTTLFDVPDNAFGTLTVVSPEEDR